MKFKALLVSAFAFAAPGVNAQDEPVQTLFTNVHIFDGLNDGRVENANVLVEGNLIRTVSTEAIDADGATVIDGGGRTLMPGLIDSHIHIAAYTPFNIDGRQNVTEFMSGGMAIVRGEAMLMRGFTTVRDLGGPSTYLRKFWDPAMAPGPRLFGSEAMITQTGGHGDFRGLTNENPNYVGGPQHWYEKYFGIIADGPDEFQRAAREAYRNGADFFKVFVSGGVTSEFDPIHALQSTQAELKAVVEIANNAQTYVTAHCQTAAGAHHAMDAGVRMLEHVPMIGDSPEVIEETVLRIKEEGVWVQFNTSTVLGRSPEELRPTMSEASYEKLLASIESYGTALKMFAKHDVKFVYGTDLVSPFGRAILGTEASLQLDEFRILPEYFDNVDVLRAATGWGGEVAAMTGPNNPYPLGPIGVIQEGAYADILLVDGNPLEEISLMTDDDNFDLIMKDGTIYKNTMDR